MLTSRVSVGVLLALLSACTPPPTIDQQRDERAREGKDAISIGVPFPWALYANADFGDGLTLAIDEINRNGGVHGRPLQVHRVDDGGTVEGARRAAQELVANPSIVAVIGHLQSAITLPTAPIYDRAGVFLLTPTVTDEAVTASGYSRIFRPTFTHEQVGRGMADAAVRGGYRRVGIYYVRDRYGRGLANAFEARARELGILVPGRESYEAGELLTTGTVVARLRTWGAVGVDAVFVAGELPSAAQVVRGVRRADSTLGILGGEAMSLPELLALGPASEGAIVAAVFHAADTHAESARFTSSFRERFGTTPGALAAVAYDAVRLVADVMTRAESPSPADMARAMRQMREWSGVTGHVTFDSLGNATAKSFLTLRVKDGQFVLWDGTQTQLAEGTRAR